MWLSVLLSMCSPFFFVQFQRLNFDRFLQAVHCLAQERYFATCSLDFLKLKLACPTDAAISATQMPVSTTWRLHAWVVLLRGICSELETFGCSTQRLRHEYNAGCRMPPQ